MIGVVSDSSDVRGNAFHRVAQTAVSKTNQSQGDSDTANGRGIRVSLKLINFLFSFGIAKKQCRHYLLPLQTSSKLNLTYAFFDFPFWNRRPCGVHAEFLSAQPHRLSVSRQKSDAFGVPMSHHATRIAIFSLRDFTYLFSAIANDFRRYVQFRKLNRISICFFFF